MNKMNNFKKIFFITIGIIIFLIVIISICPINTYKPFEVQLEANINFVDNKNVFFIKGTTNLPNDVTLKISVKDSISKDVIVANKEFKSDLFKNLYDEEFPAGKYTLLIEFDAYNFKNTKLVENIIAKDGSNLIGNKIKEKDLFFEKYKYFEYEINFDLQKSKKEIEEEKKINSLNKNNTYTNYDTETIYTGPRGGRYRINSKGEKEYIKKK